MLRIAVSDLACKYSPHHLGVFFSSVLFTAAFLLSLSIAEPARAQAATGCTPEMARVTSVQGDVEIRWAEAGAWRDARLDDVLCIGTTIRVGSFSRAALVFVDDSTLRLDENTELFIRAREEERRTWLDMITGAIHFFSHRPRALKIDTPFVNAAAEGTEFLIRIGDRQAQILMYEGIVLAGNAFGEIRLGPDDAALIRAGEKPIPQIVVRPRDAVAWTLYYPPVLTALADSSAPGAYPMQLRNALDWIGENNYRYALRSLDKVPEDERDSRHETFRAGILLNVGRVEAAEAAIERALARDPGFADAYAVRTILHVVRNERAQARRDAERAVKLAPASSAALIAQSYARQASFDLEGARQSLRAAVEKNPDDALAYARLAEIELSFADYISANDAAAQATRLAPNLARTQTVRGFAHLAEIDTDAARTAFTRSIDLYSADPLPHLGQGLAKIRDGYLEEGRRDLEIAASLDPNNALIRSYLGKAYFEEKRGPKDATQFDIAKKLDPNDPTPWFYDAIRKQTENRPVEALRDLEKAIELNDNRAVYRSRLLLDEDRAVRGTSLARIFSDIGFEQLALNQAIESLALDPSNYSAHRLLSDAFAERPRHEIARVSELLQAQLLNPVNLDPFQPSLAVADLNAALRITPTSISFAELYPLFERNGVQAAATGVIGSNGTFGEETSVSALKDRLTLSAGQLYSQTNGFRSNNDDDIELYNIFGQYFLSPSLNFQMEYRHRDSEEGDVRLNFDLDDFRSDFRRRINQDTVRIGLTFRPVKSWTVLGSGFYIKRDEEFPQNESGVIDEGNQGETRFIYQDNIFNLSFGVGAYDIEVEELSSDQITQFKREHKNAYLYTDINIMENINGSFGISYDDYQENVIRERSLNPKIGAIIDINPNLKLRGAAFKTVKRSLAADQTIEPTQLSGFNQFVDDINGSVAWNYGLGFDFKSSDAWYFGGQLHRREVDEPVFVPSLDDVLTEDRVEDILEGYIHWVPSINVVISSGATFEVVRRSGDEVVDSAEPSEVRTLRIPIAASYFADNGFFTSASLTYYDQEVEMLGSDAENSLIDFEVHDQFFIVDGLLGYNLPNRNGVLSLEIHNLFDEKFRYQDINHLVSEARRSSLVPNRTVLARFTLKL